MVGLPAGAVPGNDRRADGHAAGNGGAGNGPLRAVARRLGLSSVASTALGTTVSARLRGTASGIINTAAQLGIAFILLIAAAATGLPRPGTSAPRHRLGCPRRDCHRRSAGIHQVTQASLRNDPAPSAQRRTTHLPPIPSPGIIPKVVAPGEPDEVPGPSGVDATSSR